MRADVNRLDDELAVNRLYAFYTCGVWLTKLAGVLMLLVGAAIIVVIWSPMLLPPLKVESVPPGHYHYYYFEWPDGAPDTAPGTVLGLAIAVVGAWGLMTTRKHSGKPPEGIGHGD